MRRWLHRLRTEDCANTFKLMPAVVQNLSTAAILDNSETCLMCVPSLRTIGSTLHVLLLHVLSIITPFSYILFKSFPLPSLRAIIM